MKPAFLVPTVLCGGAGSRLWPLSRANFPKQFLALTGNETLFQQALLRAQAIPNEPISLGATLIVTNEEYRFLALDQLRELGLLYPKINRQFLLEPVGRNTAPALTMAALRALEMDQDAILLVMPADQRIQDLDAFVRATRVAVAKALQDTIVVMGIEPTCAETGYGYIKKENEPDYLGSYVVSQFTEKPNVNLANEYLASGRYYWNSGIFILKASIWLDSIKKFRPDIASACNSAWQEKKVDNTSCQEVFIRPDKDLFLDIPSESIDYAVIEKCPNSVFPLAMVQLNAGWNDLGSWDAVWQVSQKDDKGNVVNGDVLIKNSTNALVRSSNRLIGVVGLDNVIVIETVDSILVADRRESQNVKYIVNELDAQRRQEKNLHRKVVRPWGWYDSIDEDDCFKVKRIQVKPRASLSLQMHHHRAEHWIVVKGIAEITNGDKVFRLTENQSTYIPQGQIHRLANPGIDVLEIIEVQSGSYLGEDDIVRFEDAYGRA